MTRARRPETPAAADEPTPSPDVQLLLRLAGGNYALRSDWRVHLERVIGTLNNLARLSANPIESTLVDLREGVLHCLGQLIGMWLEDAEVGRWLAAGDTPDSDGPLWRVSMTFEGYARGSSAPEALANFKEGLGVAAESRRTGHVSEARASRIVDPDSVTNPPS